MASRRRRELYEASTRDGQWSHFLGASHEETDGYGRPVTNDTTRWRTTATIATAAVALLAVASPSASQAQNQADERFDRLDGPFAQFVVYPDQFGVDATRTDAAVESLVASVDGDRTRATVEALAFPRTAFGPQSARDAASALVTDALTDAGYTPQTQTVDSPGVDWPNIYADLPGTECADVMVVVGAHFDSEDPIGAAADDNATGVAAVVEMARVLRDHPLPVTVRFAGFSYEEIGLVGSEVMAKQLAADGVEVAGALSQEMLGYTEPETDPLTGLPATYLAMVADPTSEVLARVFAAAAYTYTPDFPAFGAVIDPAVLPDIYRSDHASFVRAGFPGLLATDTANFRNPNYHEPSDTVDTIDWGFLQDSTRATLAGAVTFASLDNDADGVTDLCQGGVRSGVVAPTTTTSLATTSPVPAPPTSEGPVASGNPEVRPARPATPSEGPVNFTG